MVLPHIVLDLWTAVCTVSAAEKCRLQEVLCNVKQCMTPYALLTGEVCHAARGVYSITRRRVDRKPSSF